MHRQQLCWQVLAEVMIHEFGDLPKLNYLNLINHLNATASRLVHARTCACAHAGRDALLLRDMAHRHRHARGLPPQTLSQHLLCRLAQACKRWQSSGQASKGGGSARTCQCH